MDDRRGAVEGKEERKFTRRLVSCEIKFHTKKLFDIPVFPLRFCKNFFNSFILDFVPFLWVGFRGGGSQVEINFKGRVKLTLPEKLNSKWEPLSRKTTSKKVQSRANQISIKSTLFAKKRLTEYPFFLPKLNETQWKPILESTCVYLARHLLNMLIFNSSKFK